MGPVTSHISDFFSILSYLYVLKKIAQMTMNNSEKIRSMGPVKSNISDFNQIFIFYLRTFKKHLLIRTN